MAVADPRFAVEPPRWPYAYARSVWLKGSQPDGYALLQFTLNADTLGAVIGGSGRDGAALIAARAAGAPLPAFDPFGQLDADTS